MPKNTVINCAIALSAITSTLSMNSAAVMAAQNTVTNSIVSTQVPVEIERNYTSIDSTKFFLASNMQVIPETLNLVERTEGFRAKAYIDTSAHPVIGYGQSRINGRKVRMGQYITRDRADAALERELYHIQKMVLAHVRVELNPYQLGALTSLVYNAGIRIIKNSTLIRKLNAGDRAGAARGFPRWNKANRGGKLVAFPGLTKRRLAEQKLFLTIESQIASNP